ncbi:MAG: hypothetical protein KAR06_05305 [Deltaproteobacteria bacterium]|nr:hypothetical protein [Deltaproteobacteria bacterium]
MQDGFTDVRALKGGFHAWLSAKGATESKPKGAGSEEIILRSPVSN